MNVKRIIFDNNLQLLGPAKDTCFSSGFLKQRKQAGTFLIFPLLLLLLLLLLLPNECFLYKLLPPKELVDVLSQILTHEISNSY